MNFLMTFFVEAEAYDIVMQIMIKKIFSSKGLAVFT